MTQANIFISCKESRIENNKSFYGCFHLGPFDSGQGLTVANALRRTLLSECSGLGIVSVAIDNVNHEYSTIPGVRESVLDLLLNLKEVVLRKIKKNYSLYKKDSTIYNQIGVSYFKPVSGFLKVKGPGVIRAKDLKLPPFIECVDPEQYIATLADDGFLCMKFIIMEGKGYLVPQLNRFESKSEGSNFMLSSNQQMTNEQASFASSGGLHSSSSFDYSLLRCPPTGVLPLPQREGEEATGKEQNERKKEAKESQTTNYVKKRLNFINEIKNLKKQSGAFDISLQKDINKDQEESKISGKKMQSYLNLDTVFNPVTKVSYIIEDFDNKIMDDSNKKVNFVDDVCNFIESSDYLKQNFPSFSLNNQLKTKEEFFNFIDTYSTSEIQNLSNYLQPLKGIKNQQNIILEIWTNGSIHPRDALYTAFEKLSTLFLNIKKTQSYNSIFINESALLIAGSEFNLSQTKEKEYLINTPTPVSSSLSTDDIEFLNFSLRPYTLLKRANIHTVSDLCKLTINDLKNICGFNQKYVTHILNVMTQKKLSLLS